MPRKPDVKLKAMLQLVADSKYIATGLTDIGWPMPWQAWSPDGSDVSKLWTTDDHGHTFDTAGDPQRDIWLRYHHIVPSAEDWQWIKNGDRPPMMEELKGDLITDFYAYNAYTSMERMFLSSYDPSVEPETYTQTMFGSPSLSPYGTLGLHWVGDLAFEGEVAIRSDDGELLLELVKGGVPYVCRIDIATGKATLSINNGQGKFVADDGTVAEAPSGQTAIRGQGSHKIRFTNVDAGLRLWVDEHRVQFDGPTTYAPRDDARPVTSDSHPGDLAPVGIGSRGAAVHVQRLKVLRDIYYIATNGGSIHEYRYPYNAEEIRQILQDPTSWATTKLFDERGQLEYQLEADQFFPMGDNSPQSADARMWDEHYFSRDLLIGKALLIYWPHPWYRPIPYMPNLKRMRLIH